MVPSPQQTMTSSGHKSLSLIIWTFDNTQLIKNNFFAAGRRHSLLWGRHHTFLKSQKSLLSVRAQHIYVWPEATKLSKSYLLVNASTKWPLYVTKKLLTPSRKSESLSLIYYTNFNLASYFNHLLFYPAGYTFKYN